MSAYPEVPSPKPPDAPRKPTADDALPPVSAPDASFILQLFLIPLVIVMIIVMVWLLFSWLAHLGSDPKELVQDLKVLNEGSWQKANTLSDMLRNREYDYLKDDEELAGQLSAVLLADLESGTSDEKRLRMRYFLCRALGEFRVDTGLPALLAAARPGDSGDVSMDVRYAALEALAVLAHNIGPDELASNPEVLDVLVAASRETAEGGPQRDQANELRSTAAFTLGVLGGDKAMGRLEEMLADPHPNTRFNAATGLARHGDLRAVPVLLDMLDSENAAAVEGERSDSERERKRMLVLINGIRAARQLAEQRPAQDVAGLQAALRELQAAELPNAVRLEAAEALEAFPSG